MIWALFNDIAQRLITLNKWEQKRNFSEKLKALRLSPGSKILDFGCGTGLFCNVFTKEQFEYYGYDIDERLINYANSLYQKKNCKFTASIEELTKEAPFEFILTNCCFHHIDDSTISDVLTEIQNLLDLNGIFLMIDILFAENDPSILRNLFRKLEKGAFIRKVDEYQKIVEQHFKVISSIVERSHLFSLKNNPIYNDLLILVCKKEV